MSKRNAAKQAKAARRDGGQGQFCPPGLAEKDNGCLPPGQAKRDPTAPPFASGVRGYDVPLNYRALYGDKRDFRYDSSGDIHRIDRRTNKVSAVIPLLGGSLSPAQTLPAGYDVYNVPQHYRSTFKDSDDVNYRYGDNAIYQVNPQTKMIDGVAALLSKDNFNLGAALPSGYDSYNVPLQLRSQYPDTGETLHRYANGNIYQVDAKTRVIESVIAALI